MNVIVSNNAIEYTGFIKVSKLQDVSSITGKIGFLVYHKSNESIEDKVRLLTNLRDSVDSLIYIRDPEACEKEIQMIVIGSKGKYFDDEFFLESAKELNNLLENLDEVTAIAEMGGANVLGDFFNRYLSEGSNSQEFSSQYLMVVKQAVSGMLTEYKAKDMELLQLSETATELFVNSANLLSSMEAEKEKLQSTVLDLKKIRDSYIPPSTGAKEPSISFFPQVTYPKAKNIIRIKEIGNFPRLTSFLIGYHSYLTVKKYFRVKLVIIEPPGKLYKELYKDFHWVTQENATTMEGYYNDIVFTNFPTRDVLFKLLDDNDKDTFVIVDRTKTDSKHILNCRGDVTYSVASKSFAEQLNLKPIHSFYPREIKNCLFSVPYDSNYPEEEGLRKDYYLRTYETQYERLTSIRR